MFGFLVVCVIVSMASAAPGLGYDSFGRYSASNGYDQYGVLPGATSYSNRLDHFGTPVLKTYNTPIISRTYVSPAISYHSSPVVSSYGLDHGYGLGHGYDSGHGYGNNLGYSYGNNLGYGYGNNLGHGHGW